MFKIILLFLSILFEGFASLDGHAKKRIFWPLVYDVYIDRPGLGGQRIDYR